MDDAPWAGLTLVPSFWFFFFLSVWGGILSRVARVGFLVSHGISSLGVMHTCCMLGVYFPGPPKKLLLGQRGDGVGAARRAAGRQAVRRGHGQHGLRDGPLDPRQRPCQIVFIQLCLFAGTAGARGTDDHFVLAPPYPRIFVAAHIDTPLKINKPLVLLKYLDDAGTFSPMLAQHSRMNSAQF